MLKFMAASPPIDRALFLVAIVLLPLNLISVIHRFLRRSDVRRSRCFQPAVRSALLIYLTTISVLSEIVVCSTNYHISELDQMKIQVTKLESLLEEKCKFLDSRVFELGQNKKMIEEMDKKIGLLHETLNDVKVSYGGSSVLDENIRVMDEEVKQLWDMSRRNNFDIHVSETKTSEAEKKMEEITSKIEKMQNIINEQWIQIQQLEHSLQMAKVMISRVNEKVSDDKRKGKYRFPMSWFKRSIARHSFSKLVELPDSFFLGGSVPKSSSLKAINGFKRIISATRKKHHELQYWIKQVMEMNDYTAFLAHREIIFFVATMITILPLMTAWILLYPAFVDLPQQ